MGAIVLEKALWGDRTQLPSAAPSQGGRGSDALSGFSSSPCPL